MHTVLPKRGLSQINRTLSCSVGDWSQLAVSKLYFDLVLQFCDRASGAVGGDRRDVSSGALAPTPWPQTELHKISWK